MPDSSALAADDRRSGFRTYAETVARGFYGKHQGGTFGKHDNVRTYWEDPVTRVALRPFVRQVEAARAAAGHGVRVLDLGSGSGEGYQLLTHIAQRGLTADVALQYVLPSDRLSAYMGLDLSEAMVVKGRENYAHVEGVSFHQADLRDGLGPAASRGAFRHLLLVLCGTVAPRRGPGAPAARGDRPARRARSLRGPGPGGSILS